MNLGYFGTKSESAPIIASMPSQLHLSDELSYITDHGAGLSSGGQ